MAGLSFRVDVYGTSESEPDKSVIMEVNSVEGTSEQQPILCVHDRVSGLDARIALPKGDYSGVPEALASLGQDHENIERTVRKVIALFKLFT
ncbi:MAG: hypothetical protein A3J58_03310 [Candidatus Sungbacteria bacterium RIFCSPHIGHO2_02_FULL_52_23]|uniref:Uncharacterized protein n=1 Tax=Candidatus Sungbacteria bacterium RIFCSPHIGHO2_02_FULL_52_23 TaxID=1802274 RepID=A0A1G2KXP1_9BACT|nr:MAG: hypothetical protein A3J58_03310 [Candidatus Sungbacteria bacterium RIFCSPHIGHO2_02_FULL_52_23]